MAIQSGYHERPAIINDVIKIHSGITGRSIIFTSTKRDANELCMNTVLKVEAQALHGDIPQAQREITLKVRERKTTLCSDFIAYSYDLRPDVTAQKANY